MTKLKIKKDDEEITLVDEKDIQDKLDEKAKTIVTDNLTTDSSTNALSAKQGKILNDRYKGITISCTNVPSKPYLRLFNIESTASLSSGHLIFEIFGINNDSSYAKVRVDLRRNSNSSPNGTCAVVPLNISKQTIIYDNLYFAHYIGTNKSYVDIFFKTIQYRDCIFKVYDDQLRNGKYTMYRPIVATNVANDVETYTTVEEAGTALYNDSYTNIINKSYNDIVASSFIKDGGTSSQFLKADGSVDSNTYSISNHNHDSTYIKTGTGTVTSTNIANKTIVNEDIADNAEIAYSKLSGVVSSTDYRLTDKRAPYNNSIPPNSDLDDFKNAGFYYCNGDAEVAPTIVNQPLTSGNQRSFSMIVELISSTRVVQKLTYYSTKDTYIRTNINGAWSTWNRVLHSGNYSDYANKTTVSNSLTDISTTNALSANQGKVLKGLVDGHDHDSTYIKKTGGVSQHSNGNIIIPSASDTTDNDATGKIPFAGHLVSTTYSIEEFATKLKSFIGAIKDKDNRWWNVISARQTNGGGSDGEKQGLLLKTGLEATGDLIWNKQSTGNWGTERTILDSSNYSNYANKTTVDTALSSTSTNPVQNKVINTALGNKADKSSYVTCTITYTNGSTETINLVTR